MAAAAAAAATEEFCPSLSSETIQVIHVAARAATAATAAALGRSPLELSGAPPCQSRSASASAANDPGVGRQEDAVAGSGAAGSGRRGDVARASGGVLHGRGGYERGTGASSGGVELPGSAEGRKPRTPIPLRSKLSLIDIADAGHTESETPSIFRLNISVPAARAIEKERDEYKRRAAVSEDLSASCLRRSYLESVSKGLWDWYRTLQRAGGSHLPVSGGLLDARARRIAA